MLNTGLIWRVPDPSSKREMVPKTPEDMQNLYGFIVREYEHALYLMKGVFKSSCTPGYYILEEETRVPGTEVIYVRTNEFKIKWGVTEALSSDSVMMGCHGIAFMKIDNPYNLIINVFSNWNLVNEMDIEKWIRESLIGIIKDAISTMEVEDLYRDRIVFIDNIIAETEQLLGRWGLSLVNIELLGVRIPEEYKKTLQTNAELKILQNEAKLRQARKDLKQNQEILEEHSTLDLNKFKELLAFFEKRTREIIEKVLSSYYKDWWIEGVSPNIRDLAIELLDKVKEKDLSLGLSEKTYNKLEFIDFSSYYEIIKSNWKFFETFLYDKKRLYIFFEEISHARNTIAHHRELDPELQSACESYMKRILQLYSNWEKLQI